MNAFTASDWTAYPFATRNRKDFDNLLGVYLDAVFFPRLDPLTSPMGDTALNTKRRITARRRWFIGAWSTTR